MLVMFRKLLITTITLVRVYTQPTVVIFSTTTSQIRKRRLTTIVTYKSFRYPLIKTHIKVYADPQWGLGWFIPT